MSEKTEIALLKMFQIEMDKISASYANLRKWTYALIFIFAGAVLGAMYWAGSINQKVEHMATNVKDIKTQVDRIESKYNEMVLFLVRDFGFDPKARVNIASNYKTNL